MNNDTITAAKQHAMFHIHPDTSADSFLDGAKYMQAQKDEQIKELVEGLQWCIDNLPLHRSERDKLDELIKIHITII